MMRVKANRPLVPFRNLLQAWIYVSSFLCFAEDSIAESAFNLPAVNYSLADAVKTDVTYHLFINASDSVYTDETKISNLYIDQHLPLKILIHGWLSNETTYWYQPLKDEYFKKKGPLTIILIDWSKAGSKEYEIAAANAKPIGEFIGDFILSTKVELDRVHVIGHSLGAHVAGFVGKRVRLKSGKAIGRITATDPAAPSFEHADVKEDGRLARDDARFVDVIHTDVGHYGYSAPIGHVDFYPNGGGLQPGCPSYDVNDNCSHARSNLYFIESIDADDFKATRCNSWSRYVSGKCRPDDGRIVFGENVPENARGVYYFKTRSESPFLAVG